MPAVGEVLQMRCSSDEPQIAIATALAEMLAAMEGQLGSIGCVHSILATTTAAAAVMAQKQWQVGR